MKILCLVYFAFGWTVQTRTNHSGTRSSVAIERLTMNNIDVIESNHSDHDDYSNISNTIFVTNQTDRYSHHYISQSSSQRYRFTDISRLKQYPNLGTNHKLTTYTMSTKKSKQYRSHKVHNRKARELQGLIPVGKGKGKGKGRRRMGKGRRNGKGKGNMGMIPPSIPASTKSPKSSGRTNIPTTFATTPSIPPTSISSSTTFITTTFEPTPIVTGTSSPSPSSVTTIGPTVSFQPTTSTRFPTSFSTTIVPTTTGTSLFTITPTPSSTSGTTTIPTTLSSPLATPTTTLAPASIPTSTSITPSTPSGTTVPTRAPIPLTGPVVTATPFTVLYTPTVSGATQANIDEAAQVTCNHIEQSIQDVFLLSNPFIIVAGITCQSVGSGTNPTTIGYVLNVTFADGGTVVPTIDDIDRLINIALRAPQVLVLVDDLSQLTNNPFSTVTDATYGITRRSINIADLFLPSIKTDPASETTTTTRTSSTILSQNQVETLSSNKQRQPIIGLVLNLVFGIVIGLFVSFTVLKKKKDNKSNATRKKLDSFVT